MPAVKLSAFYEWGRLGQTLQGVKIWEHYTAHAGNLNFMPFLIGLNQCKSINKLSHLGDSRGQHINLLPHFGGSCCTLRFGGAASKHVLFVFRNHCKSINLGLYYSIGGAGGQKKYGPIVTFWGIWCKLRFETAALHALVVSLRLPLFQTPHRPTLHITWGTHITGGPK